MSTLSETVERFVQVVDTHQTLQDLQTGMAAVHPHIPAASPAELAAALHALLPVIQTKEIVPVGCAVITCGAMIEAGGDPEICGPAILDRLPQFLRDLAGFHAAVSERADPNEEVDRNDLIDRHFGELFQSNRDFACAYLAERSLSLGAIAHLSKSKKLRATARSRPELLELSEAASAACGQTSFLTDMLRVLDDESLIVLHPGERKGYEVRISGVADNFQLHTLLAGELIGDPKDGWLSGRKPDPAVVAVARDAEWTDQLHAEGAFNLWNWPGLQLDGTLPTGYAGGDSWIWNEGNPGDILPFDGKRVALLGPPPYSRSWNAGRRFPNMPAEFRVERVLTPAEVTDWLTRIASAPRPKANE